MPVFTQLKAIITGVIVLVVLIAATLIYWRGSSSQATKTDLRVAREVIKTERETLKITSQIDMRVNVEGLQTAQTAQDATHEIESIRQARPPVVADPLPDGGLADRCDSACARVLQLAREARAAALASGARLQSARTGAR